MTTKQTQIKLVEAALLAREPVDQVEAINRGWGLRLGALIHRLKIRGWPVLAVRDHNNGLARYHLPGEWMPHTNLTPVPEIATTGRLTADSGMMRGDRHPVSTNTPA
ncbi:MAG: hypothetical protein ACOYMG_07955 [Candidatus Methylumidiphilus sp.]